VRAAAKKLTPQTWQHFRRGFKNYTEVDTVDGTTPARRTATREGGPCVFLNDADFPGGWGCALHAQALRDGVHPLEYKPDVCWQLPIRRDQEWTKRPDKSKVLVSTRSEEHTSELQSQSNLVCRLLLEKKKQTESLDLTATPY